MIKKNIKVTTIVSTTVDVENAETVVKNLDTVTTTKKVTEKNAAKIVRAALDFNGSVFINSIKTDIVRYEMDDDTFMKYAKAVEV